MTQPSTGTRFPILSQRISFIVFAISASPPPGIFCKAERYLAITQASRHAAIKSKSKTWSLIWRTARFSRKPMPHRGGGIRAAMKSNWKSISRRKSWKICTSIMLTCSHNTKMFWPLWKFAKSQVIARPLSTTGVPTEIWSHLSVTMLTTSRKYISLNFSALPIAARSLGNPTGISGRWNTFRLGEVRNSHREVPSNGELLRRAVFRKSWPAGERVSER